MAAERRPDGPGTLTASATVSVVGERPPRGDAWHPVLADHFERQLCSGIAADQQTAALLDQVAVALGDAATAQRERAMAAQRWAEEERHLRQQLDVTLAWRREVESRASFQVLARLWQAASRVIPPGSRGSAAVRRLTRPFKRATR